MVPYYGHYSAKMFILGKSIRFGYKPWMLCSSDGYPYQASIYCGRTDRPDDINLGDHVVLEFAKLITNPINPKLFFDNFFPSYHLISELSEMSVRATGTARDGQIGNAPFTTKNVFKKKARRFYEHFSDGRICICRWNHNNVVTAMTNFDHTFRVKHVQCHVK